VAREVELGESTVRRIFAAFTERANARYTPQAPPWLGIDEIYLLGRPRAVFTNLRRRYVIDLLEDRSKPVVTQYLLHLGQRERTEVVSIDMWRPYKDAVNLAMPRAAVVIDKFHVLRTATSGLEGARKAVRKGLNSRQRVQLKNDRFLLLRRASKLKPTDRLIVDAWGGAYPELHRAWELKESFYAIYDAESKEEARERMRAWAATVPTSLRTAATFKDSINALKNWEPEILAYWDFPATNAYTESLNNQIRSIERQGRGYSLEVLRAKLLFTPPTWVEKEMEQRATKRATLPPGTPSWALNLPPGWSVQKIGDLWVLVPKGFDSAANASFAISV
jgi:transposase